MVHGDDLTALGLQPDLEWYEKELAKSFELKIRGRIGENTELKTMKILNRIVTLTPEGLIYESDPRHAELMVRNLGLGDSKGVGTPGVKHPDISDEAPKDNGTDPWDDEPWRDSKPDGYSKVGTVGDDDDDKKSCGNLLDSHEKRKLEQLKACILQSLYGCSDGAGSCQSSRLRGGQNHTPADSQASSDSSCQSSKLHLTPAGIRRMHNSASRALYTSGRQQGQTYTGILYMHRHISRTLCLHWWGVVWR